MLKLIYFSFQLEFKISLTIILYTFIVITLYFTNMINIITKYNNTNLAYIIKTYLY